MTAIWPSSSSIGYRLSRGGDSGANPLGQASYPAISHDAEVVAPLGESKQGSLLGRVFIRAARVAIQLLSLLLRPVLERRALRVGGKSRRVSLGGHNEGRLDPPHFFGIHAGRFMAEQRRAYEARIKVQL